jgi:archaellum biogenesis ATPase FlaH
MPNDDNTLPLNGKTPQQQWAPGYLKDRAVPLKFAIKCGIRVQPDRRKGGNGASFRGASKNDRGGAIVFPYFNHDGTRRDFKRYRFTDEVAQRRKQKFDQDKDSGAHLYMPPLNDKKLTMQKVFADTSIPLNIAEGETRALAANSLGVPTVAIGGIDMGVVNGELLRDLRSIPMRGRRVPLLIDADVSRREDKQNSVIKFTRALEEQGANVYLMPAPGEGNEGWDDFIAANGAKAFRKMLAEAKSCNDQAFASWGYDGIDLSLSLSPISIDWLTEAPPHREWTLEGFLPRGTVALLNGQGGAGKSFLVQRLLQCIAGGIPFLGNTTRQGKAVYIACEESPDELRRRQYKTFQYEIADMGHAEAKRFATALQKNLYIQSITGQQFHLVTMRGNNVIQGRALDVLIHQLDALGDIEIVVIDPISRAHSAADENAAAWGTAMMNALARLTLDVGCSAMGSHHTGKGKSQGGEREDQYSGRGSSALPDAARVVLQLKVAKPEECRAISNVSDDEASTGQILRLINSKQSYGTYQPPLWLRRTEGGVLDRFEPERRASVADNMNIQMLRSWWESKHECKPLFRHKVMKCFQEIFDGTLSRRAAVKVFESAIAEGHLVLITNGKASGSGYVFKGKTP